jgi:hypothetical protein
MDESLLQFALKAFVTLIVVVDPLGVAPIFVALTSEFGATQRNQTLRRALIIVPYEEAGRQTCGPDSSQLLLAGEAWPQS